VAARSTAWACGRSLSGIAGSNLLAGGGAWMSVSCECCVSSSRGLCDELINRPEESYRVCMCVHLRACVCVCQWRWSRATLIHLKWVGRKKFRLWKWERKALLRVFCESEFLISISHIKNCIKKIIRLAETKQQCTVRSGLQIHVFVKRRP